MISQKEIFSACFKIVVENLNKKSTCDEPAFNCGENHLSAFL